MAECLSVGVVLARAQDEGANVEGEAEDALTHSHLWAQQSAEPCRPELEKLDQGDCWSRESPA